MYKAALTLYLLTCLGVGCCSGADFPTANADRTFPVASATVPSTQKVTFCGCLSTGKCTCYEGECGCATCRDSAALRLTTPVAVSRTMAYRNPIGHTHTCPRCGEVWDHNKNPGHVCQRCGASQFVQDPTPRMVQVRSQAAMSAPLQYALPQSLGGGCGPGGCPAQPAGVRMFRR